MAHKKGQGSSRNGRDSNPQYREVKVFDGETIKAGGIIARQVGTRVHPGNNVGLGRDFTLFALIPGKVKFERYDRTRRKVSVYPIVAAATPVPVAAE